METLHLTNLTCPDGGDLPAFDGTGMANALGDSHAEHPPNPEDEHVT